jgi:hypothetical protein
MTEGIPEGQDSQVEETGSETQGQEAVESTDTGTGINPAWNDLLSSVPTGLHSQITPHLNKWDQNFQSKISEVHSQYEPYKPFIENNVQADQIQYALGIMSAIEERPQEVLNALKAYIGEEEQQGLVDNSGNGPDETEQPEWMNHPEWKKTQEMVNAIAQILVEQRQTSTQAEMDSQLDQELTAAKEKFGDYDEEWVLNHALNKNVTIEQAAQAYKDFENQIISKNRQPGPPVLGAGGSVPNPSFDPSKMDDKDRRATVAQILANAANQNH